MHGVLVCVVPRESEVTGRDVTAIRVASGPAFAAPMARFREEPSRGW